MAKLLKLLTFVFLITLVYACDEEATPAPNDLIEKEKMVLILKDVSKIEARFQRRLSLHGKNSSDLVFENYKMIFDTYEVSVEQFKTSYTYYQDSPKAIQELYDSVIVELTKEQSQLELKEPAVDKMNTE